MAWLPLQKIAIDNFSFIFTFRECMKVTGENESQCLDSRKLFTDLCPGTWVTHFDRKFEYEKFKTKLAQTGLEEMDKKHSGS